MGSSSQEVGAVASDQPCQEKEKPSKVYQCKFCDKSFSCPRALGGHQTTHRIEREQGVKEKLAGNAGDEANAKQCTFCDMKFTCPRAFGGHQTLHRDERAQAKRAKITADAVKEANRGQAATLDEVASSLTCVQEGEKERRELVTINFVLSDSRGFAQEEEEDGEQATTMDEAASNSGRAQEREKEYEELDLTLRL